MFKRKQPTRQEEHDESESGFWRPNLWRLVRDAIDDNAKTLRLLFVLGALIVLVIVARGGIQITFGGLSARVFLDH